MAGLVWVMVGLAIWHFTVFLPDRFWAGIVGAFVGACVGAFLSGWLLSGLSVPGNNALNIGDVLISVPGALLGMAAVYFIGVRQEHLDDKARGGEVIRGDLEAGGFSDGHRANLRA